MLKDKYKIILYKENQFELKQYSFSILSALAVLVIFISFFGMNIYFFSGDILDYFEFKEIQSHRGNNAKLINTIEEQNSKIEQITNLIDSLKIQEEKFRKLVKLPSIHKEVKQLGTGKRNDKNQSLNNLEYLLPNKIIKLNNTADQIDNLYRLINLEKLSYYDILEKAEEDLKKLVKFPAIHPVDMKKSKRSSGYGYRRDPFSNKYTFHSGVDYSGKRGDPIYATADGTIRVSQYYSTFGNYIEIDHGYGYKTCYGHLSKRLVKPGDKVERGEKIGEIGNTGRSTAPHLHYEIQYYKKTKDPKDFYFDIYNFN